MTNVTNEQAAYMAAAIDGEGHIGIGRSSKERGVGVASPRFQFRVLVTNTNRAWLEELQRWFGGRLVEMHGETERKRACYALRFMSTDAKALLIRVRPYLLMKARHVELMMRYFELAATRRLFSVNAKPTDQQVIAQQEAVYSEMRSLNLTRKIQPLRMTRPQRSCSIDGCETKHYGKGYCWIHYRKFIVRGGPAAYEKRCVVCGTEFVSKRVDTECCSRRCTDRRYYELNAERLKAKAAEYKARKKQTPM